MYGVKNDIELHSHSDQFDMCVHACVWLLVVVDYSHGMFM